MQHCKGKVQLTCRAKSFKQIDEDFQDVEIEGYASTKDFDRYGEAFVDGAWGKAIKAFMNTNPVLLLDHKYNVDSIIGRVTNLYEDSKGLFMTAKISNAPGLADLRYKVKEGFVSAVSVSGNWDYDKKGVMITEVTDLYEISLVGVPANPNALITSKSFGDSIETITTSYLRIKQNGQLAIKG